MLIPFPSGTTESSLPTPVMVVSKRPGARAKSCDPPRKKARVGSIYSISQLQIFLRSQLPALSEAEACTVLQVTAAGSRGCSRGCNASNALPEGTNLQDQMEASPPSANTRGRKRARVGSFSHDQLLPFSVIAASYSARFCEVLKHYFHAIHAVRFCRLLQQALPVVALRQRA